MLPYSVPKQLQLTLHYNQKEAVLAMDPPSIAFLNGMQNGGPDFWYKIVMLVGTSLDVHLKSQQGQLPVLGVLTEAQVKLTYKILFLIP